MLGRTSDIFAFMSQRLIACDASERSKHAPRGDAKRGENASQTVARTQPLVDVPVTKSVGEQ